MSMAADDVVEGLPLPELPVSAQTSVDSMRCKRLPCLKDFFQPKALLRCYQHMDVIGHDHPLIQVIASPVKRLHGINNDLDA